LDPGKIDIGKIAWEKMPEKYSRKKLSGKKCREKAVGKNYMGKLLVKNGIQTKSMI
jgi:hypothetical protein